MDERICLESDCNRKAGWRGLCKSHYDKTRRAGKPLPNNPGLALRSKHIRTNIDEDALRADCSICGPHVRIKIRRDPKRGRYECRPSKRKGPRTPKTPIERRLYALYKIAYEEYLVMVQAQAGRCLICQTEPPKPLRVDHCHETGIVRGLLCDRCNFALGWLNDDPNLCVRAAKYLRRFAA